MLTHRPNQPRIFVYEISIGPARLHAKTKTRQGPGPAAADNPCAAPPDRASARVSRGRASGGRRWARPGRLRLPTRPPFATVDVMKRMSLEAARLYRRAALALLLISASRTNAVEPPAGGRANPVLAPLTQLYPELEAFYRELHQAPELSLHEEKTSAKLAARLRAEGLETTERVGGWGIVGVLKNGPGPTVLARTDMDALPVEEKTGLPYASKATAVDDEGKTTPVMHACGHDIHMTEWVAAAALLSRARSQWRGVVLFVGQPAEERVAGARAMLDDRLYERFGKPDFALAFHDHADLPAGKIGWTSGYCYANVDSVDITFFGKGGHGAAPHKTVDPIVLAARFVTSLQSIVARENNPLDPAVITVGSFHAGSKHNIIPDQAQLKLTVRSYKDEVRKKLLAGIRRLADSESLAAGSPKPPELRFSEATPAVYNDPALTRRLVGAIGQALGADALVETPPSMVSEDFTYFSANGVPGCLLSVGAVNPARFQEAQRAGADLPSLHSGFFAPDPEPTLKTGAAALTVALLELLGKP